MISEVFCMDNMEYMASVPDKFFDLVIADPPYGINATEMSMGSNPNRKGIGQGGGISTAIKLKGRLNSGSGKLKNTVLNNSSIGWDTQKPSQKFFTELLRISKNAIIWGGNYFDLPPTRGIIFWDKLQPWENFSQFELAWTSFDKPAAKIAISTTGGNNTECKIHPTQKPVKLYKWLLSKYANRGDKIFDPNMGSQSSRIAAWDMGFDYWGVEIDPDYFADGNKRFELFKQQQTLFT